MKISELADQAPSGQRILRSINDITKTLLKKNISYGNSALEYNSVFGNLSAKEALYARINDKIQRIANNQSYETEGMKDAVDDLIGYLVLLKILLDEDDSV